MTAKNKASKKEKKKKVQQNTGTEDNVWTTP